MSAYIENKCLDDLSSQWRIDFGKQWLDVYVWNSVVGLRSNARFRKKDYLGAYVWHNGRKKTTGLFGEIHLIRDQIGAGYVAHELQHFIYDWMGHYLVCYRNNVTSEKCAKLLGDITNKFWIAFYERYELDEPGQ